MAVVPEDEKDRRLAARVSSNIDLITTLLTPPRCDDARKHSNTSLLMCTSKTSWTHFAALVLAALLVFVTAVVPKRVDLLTLEPTGFGVPARVRKGLRVGELQVLEALYCCGSL
jgi:hypothetical protein